MNNKELFIIIFVLILGYVCSGIIHQMCSARLVEGLGLDGVCDQYTKKNVCSVTDQDDPKKGIRTKPGPPEPKCFCVTCADYGEGVDDNGNCVQCGTGEGLNDQGKCQKYTNLKPAERTSEKDQFGVELQGVMEQSLQPGKSCYEKEPSGHFWKADKIWGDEDGTDCKPLIGTDQYCLKRNTTDNKNVNNPGSAKCHCWTDPGDFWLESSYNSNGPEAGSPRAPPVKYVSCNHHE